MENKINLRIKPLVPENLKDLEVLFGPNGACEGCWCMYWLLRRADYEIMRKTGETKRQLWKLVKEGMKPGILAYDGTIAVGWCALQPREKYIRLKTSRILKPVDEQHVWSIVCFFMHRNYRNQGITAALLSHAKEFARSRGAKILEAYPTEPQRKTSPAFLYTGIASTFIRAGFTEVARRSPTRPVMRYYL